MNDQLLFELFDFTGEVEGRGKEKVVFLCYFFHAIDGIGYEVFFAEIFRGWKVIDSLIRFYFPDKFFVNVGIDPIDVNLFFGFWMNGLLP